ncbi:MAG: RNA methyltransferase [Actinomycetaceae bacterium]|nr:RNA methyltransferase [Actinomycetaceae bacterium]
MRVDITDLTDPALADYTNMTDVALRSKVEPERGLFMAESRNVILRAVEAGYRPRSFLMAEKWLDSMSDILDKFPHVPVYVANEDALRQLTGFHLHRGALASMHRKELPQACQLLAQARRIAILEDIVDHTNVGAIFRSAAALGVDAILVTPSCADPLYRRSVRVSMGTVFQIPWTRLDTWPAPQLLNEYNYHSVALALEADSRTLDDFCSFLRCAPDQKVAWVLGSEGYGLKPRTISSLDSKVIIPMSHGVDSLNVAAAAAVVFWATRPQSSSAGVKPHLSM